MKPRVVGHSASLLVSLPSLLVCVRCDKYCGTNLENARDLCWQPCGVDEDCCSFAQRCYETGSSCPDSGLVGTQHYFCGTSWCDAAYKCGIPCPNENECPDGEWCWADTPCNRYAPSPVPPLPPPPTSSLRQFCGSSLETAKSNCWQPCPRGNSDCCLGLNCFDTEGTCRDPDYSGSNHNFCGKSWCDAAYSCGATCPGGLDRECPSGTYCYADVPCDSRGDQTPPVVIPPTGGLSTNTLGYKYCGKSSTDAATRCWQSCEFDSDCCFDQRCYDTGDLCGPSYYDGPNHSYCGVSLCDAMTKCSVPCPNGNECPSGELCFDNTPCDSFIPSTQPFYCGLGVAEASDKCWQPCPSGQDSECCHGQTCHNTGGSCLTSVPPSSNRRYCGSDFCEASYQCNNPCPSGLDSDCPSGEQCYDNTPCSSYLAPPSTQFAYCGINAADAADNCWQPCRDDSDCCYGQRCYPSAASCGNPNFQGSSHFFCGLNYCDASFKCGKPCPSGFSAECDDGQICWANTPCDNGISGYGLPSAALSLAQKFTTQKNIPQTNTAFSHLRCLHSCVMIMFAFGLSSSLFW